MSDLFRSENLFSARDFANIHKIYQEVIFFVLVGVCSVNSNMTFILKVGVRT